MTLEAFLAYLEKPRRNGRGFLACCPAHDDRSPSLSISEGDDGRVLVLVKCWAGCTAQEIVEALGLTLSDLFEGKQTREGQNHRRTLKAKAERITQAGFCRAALYRAALYRRADAVLEALKDAYLSGLSKAEKNRISDIGLNAHVILNEEIKHERKTSWNRK